MTTMEELQQTAIGIDELLQLVHSVNYADRTKTLHDCVDDELDMVLQKVNEYRKNAEITIKINIAQGDRNQLNITGTVTSKAPKGKINQNIFYLDSKDAKLFIDDPNQLKIFKVREFPKQETHAKGASID